MSVAIHIEFYQEGEKLKSINIGPEDREIEGMLRNSGSVTGIGVEYDKKGLWTEEEEGMMKFYQVHELISETKIISAKSVLSLFNKVDTQVWLKSFKSFIHSLDTIDSYDLEKEEIDRRKDSLFSEFTGFEYQRSKLIGVLEVAVAFEYDVKIVSEFY